MVSQCINPAITRCALIALKARLSRAKHETAGSLARSSETPPFAVENGSFPGFCRSAQRGIEGAGKTIGTDYRFAGPGRATRKPVGKGRPSTPGHKEQLA